MAQGRTDLLPLTTAQRGLWMGSQLAPPGATFNIAEAVEIVGAINPELFVRALAQVSSEAETTRLRIVTTAEGPMQELMPFPRTDFPTIDMSAEADPDRAAYDWMRTYLLKAVDLERDPLWFGALIKVGIERFFWFHCCHHTIMDGYSAGMVAARLAASHDAILDAAQ